MLCHVYRNACTHSHILDFLQISCTLRSDPLTECESILFIYFTYFVFSELETHYRAFLSNLKDCSSSLYICHCILKVCRISWQSIGIWLEVWTDKLAYQEIHILWFSTPLHQLYLWNSTWVQLSTSDIKLIYRVESHTWVFSYGNRVLKLLK